MIGLEPVKKFISLNIFSDYIKGERPISSFIVAEPEHGKTETLASFEDVQGVLMLLDVTAYGSATFIFSRILAKEVRRLIFPDFSRILARSRTVVDEVITMINAIVEDGINWAILTKNIQWIPIVKEKVYAGVTIAITPKSLEKVKKRYREMGFISRTLPFHYDYTEEDLEKVHEFLKTGKAKFERLKLKIPKEDVEVSMSKELADLLDPAVRLLSKVLETYTGFRLRRQLQTLCKANALMNGRTEVIEEDVKEILAFTPFFYNPLKGDECMWRILRVLPAKSEEIVKELSDYYSRATVYNKLKELREAGLIYQAGSEWKSILF